MFFADISLCVETTSIANSKRQLHLIVVADCHNRRVNESDYYSSMLK